MSSCERFVDELTSDSTFAQLLTSIPPSVLDKFNNGILNDERMSKFSLYLYPCVFVLSWRVLEYLLFDLSSHVL